MFLSLKLIIALHTLNTTGFAVIELDKLIFCMFHVQKTETANIGVASLKVYYE